MRKKVTEAVIKLSSVVMNHHQAATYYNVCMLASAHFGCGIVELDEQ